MNSLPKLYCVMTILPVYVNTQLIVFNAFYLKFICNYLFVYPICCLFVYVLSLRHSPTYKHSHILDGFTRLFNFSPAWFHSWLCLSMGSIISSDLCILIIFSSYLPSCLAHGLMILLKRAIINQAVLLLPSLMELTAVVAT